MIIFRALLILALGASPLTACKRQTAPAEAAAEASEADKQAAELLKEAWNFIDQKKVEEAEVPLTKLIALKNKLSPKSKELIQSAIAGVGFVDPSRAVKLAKLFEE